MTDIAPQSSLCYDLNIMTQYQYVTVLTPQEEGGYTATVPALQGCISEGDTKEEALANIRDAIEGYLFVAKKQNLYPFTGIQKLEEVEVVSGVLQYA